MNPLKVGYTKVLRNGRSNS